MTARDRKPPAPVTPPPADAPAPKSGRVRFDERGQAVWEWAVRTGMFDRNASTQRVRALTDDNTGGLTIEDTPKPAAPASAATFNPYERVTAKPGESVGGNPYSRGPARRPENVTFNPYDRGAGRKR